MASKRALRNITNGPGKENSLLYAKPSRNVSSLVKKVNRDTNTLGPKRAAV